MDSCEKPNAGKTMKATGHKRTGRRGETDASVADINATTTK